MTSKLRDHVTIAPPVVISLEKNKKGGQTVSKIHRPPSLWVFPRAYVNSKLANSKFDPTNQDEVHKAENTYKIKTRPVSPID